MFHCFVFACLTTSFVRAWPVLSPNIAATPHNVLQRQIQAVTDLDDVSTETGTVITTLESGLPTSQPFATSSIPSVTSTIKFEPLETIERVIEATAAPSVSALFGTPISTGGPAAVISSRPDHPVPKLGIDNQSDPIGTNKFYANFFLGNQTNPVWTHPYSLVWNKGTGNAASWGLGVSHIEANQLSYGPNATSNPVEFYVNPLGIESIIFSAAELDSSMSMVTDTLTAFSANANFVVGSTTSAAITFPLTQGMGFVTAIYNGVTPYIDSGVFFHTVTMLDSPKAGISKYKILLNDNSTWLLYASSSDDSGLVLSLASTTRLSAAGPFNGTIQIAKNPGDIAAQEVIYDSCAGAYAKTTTISGSTNGASGSYTLGWTKGGINDAALIMFALPHHIGSMDGPTTAAKTKIQLRSTTKGLATAVVADSWTMIEPDMPVVVGFAPWGASSGFNGTIPANAQEAIDKAGTSDLSQDMDAQSNLNSMYYSGKALSKFATAIYAVHDLAGNSGLSNAGLAKLKDAYARFVNNTQQYPLVYESQWGGVVSSASYVTGNSGDDFGNTYYNDHHFHWSYFVHAASIIGYLDPTWLPANQNWVNTLIRDAANPSTDDKHFPFSRCFDWYHGHSWAKGLFDSADGKDQESTSEDAFFSYAMKMWGKTIGDAAMEARGNLMLAVQKRSFQNYFLLESTNTNQPANFIANKVTGILFENKVDHTTYFGSNPEYIEGIHMIPINPSSAYTRNPTFVTEEWNTYFSNGRVDLVTGGWRGILYSDLAIIDPKTTYNWVSGPNFDPQYLDDGATQTWYLAYSAGLGGAS